MRQANLKRAARVLRAGGIVAHATESVWGFACDAQNPRALARVWQIKRRPRFKRFIVLAADLHQLEHWLEPLPARVTDTWPGPYTWVVPTTPRVPRALRARDGTLAVRVSAHRQAAALCRAFGGPIISTSLNRSGERPVRLYREALRRFGAEVDMVLPGRVGRARKPTQIADAKTGRILRSA